MGSIVVYQQFLSLKSNLTHVSDVQKKSYFKIYIDRYTTHINLLASIQQPSLLEM